MNKNNFFGFQYPCRSTGWHWEFPWNLRKWYYWFYHTWESKTKRKSIWRGKIICGFKKIEIWWDCNPTEAYLEHLEGERRLLQYLIELTKENPKHGIEETRLFK